MKKSIIDFLWANKRYFFWVVDMITIACVYLVFSALLWGPYETVHKASFLARTYLISAVVYTITLFLGGSYSIILKYCGVYDFIRFVITSLISLIAILSFCAIPTIVFPVIPSGIIILSNLFIAIALSGTRFLAKYYINRSGAYRISEKTPVLIIGAGNAGNLMAQEIRSNDLDQELIGFIDDNPRKLGITINGVKVLGTRDDIIKICEFFSVKLIYICIPSTKSSEIQKIVEICSETACKVKVLPTFDEMLKSEKNFSNIKKGMRDVDISDLLERDPIILDANEMSSCIYGKTILVTGGGGSIGSELCRQIAKYNPEKLIVLDIYENNAYSLQNELKKVFPKLRLDVIIASVRDKKKLEIIFDTYRPQIVYHAAAHKHVPLMEHSPDEAIKNNVFGTYNVAFCADKYKVETFTLISTDKAVNPTNVMGATKRICEMIVQAFSAVSETKFVAVRFGNVLGSNGSVIPLFKRQIAEGGPVTLTHKDITRYFMTIPEASQLVLQASAFAKGGEIFILDMGKPVKIYHLAEKLIKLSGYTPEVDIKIEVVGLRPGEKLYEELLMAEEGLLNTKNSKIFIGKPIFTDMNVLKAYLNKLSSVIDSNDKAKIKQAVSEIVDTYKPDLEHI